LNGVYLYKFCALPFHNIQQKARLSKRAFRKYNRFYLFSERNVWNIPVTLGQKNDMVNALIDSIYFILAHRAYKTFLKIAQLPAM